MFDVPLLEKAMEITSQDRQKDYGHPLVDFLTESLVLSILNHEIYTPLKLVRDRYVTKIVRESNRFKDDNHLDMAGYASTVDQCDRLMKDLGYVGIEEFEGYEATDWCDAVYGMVIMLDDAQDHLKVEYSDE
jgi:hypothetical protein